MERGTERAVYDTELRLEAYRFRRCFPMHFHEYYVVGCVAEGRGTMICRNREYLLEKEMLVICNPGDSHACAESGKNLDFWGLHIPRKTVLDLTEELTGQRTPPLFSQNVVTDEEAVCCFRSLHQEIMSGSRTFGKEEDLLRLFSRLFQLCGRPLRDSALPDGYTVEPARTFIERHFGERITLERLCREAGMSKSALLRAFTRELGVTPYRYLENIRIGEAKKLLEQGVPPAETALRTGFSDQSHFTNYFSRFIGLSPGAYQEIFSDRRSGERGEENGQQE